jgi:hypothetical protein
MPNPLKSVTSNPGQVLFKPDALAQRPTLALRALSIINQWSKIDVQKAGLFADIIHTQTLLAAKLLNSLESDSAREALISSAIKDRFGDEGVELYYDVQRPAKASKKARNCFAHHVWGTAENLPEAILLVDGKYFAEFAAGRKEELKTYDELNAFARYLESKEPTKKIGRFDHSEVFVYVEADFELYEKQAFKLHGALTVLRHFAGETPFSGASPRAQLEKLNLIPQKSQTHKKMTTQ